MATKKLTKTQLQALLGEKTETSKKAAVIFLAFSPRSPTLK